MGNLFTIIVIFISLSTYAQDFRQVKWLESKDSVIANEKAIFLDASTKTNYREEVHFVEFSEGFALHIFYLFRKNQLIGIKTQRSRLSGDNTKYNALQDYQVRKQEIIEKWGKEVISEKDGIEQAIKSLTVHLSDRDIYITIEKGIGYVLVENIFMPHSSY